MTEVYDLADITDHVRRSIKRSGIKRKSYVARMQRFVRVTQMLLDPQISFHRIVFDSALSVSDFYGAMWMLLVADTFRGEREDAGIVGDFFQFTDDEVVLLNRVWCLLHDRYFGIPTTAMVVVSKDDQR
jgi:hypothetical protein